MEIKNLIKLITTVLVLFLACKNEKVAKNTKQSLCKENEVITRLVQKVIDYNELQKYFHLKDSSRLPLMILKDKPLLKNLLGLKKGGQEVLLIDREDIVGLNYIEFHTLLIENDSAYINMTYPIEGIKIILNYKKNKCTWDLYKSSIVEN